MGQLPAAEFINLKVEAHVLWIEINRPAVLNALHPPAHAELALAFDHFCADDGLWIAVITGHGSKAFCTGSDLKERAALGGDDMPATGFAGITERFDRYKPVVAMVNGHCIGGGLEIALACDVVIAADHALFGLPEPKVGLAATGGLHRLFRQIPYAKAMEIMLTGKLFGAADAADLGVVNQVVSADELEACVSRWVEQIMACSPLAIQASMQLAKDGLNQPSLQEAFGGEYSRLDKMLASDDAREGTAAFIGKRPPRWRGT